MNKERFEYEKKAYDAGYTCIAGCDEAGRGPLAGPLCVGAVVFEKDFYDERINDSKKLSAKKREELYDFIIEHAKAYKVVVIEPKRIDEINIYEASRQGMIEAYEGLDVKVDYVLTDAMPLKNGMPHDHIIKGDQLSISIAAASILAKVTRDRIMEELDKKYPQYNFKKHKGYPTKEHMELLKQYGPSDVHRMSYRPCQEAVNVQLQLDLNEIK